MKKMIVSDFSKVAGYKTIIRTAITHLHTHTQIRIIHFKTIPLSTALTTKYIDIFRDKFLKIMQDWKLKTLLEELNMSCS